MGVLVSLLALESLLPPESVVESSSFAAVPVAHAIKPANPAANIVRTTRMETLALQISRIDRAKHGQLRIRRRRDDSPKGTQLRIRRRRDDSPKGT
jgi:hypothetical protein